MPKIISPAEAANLVQDGQTFATDGFLLNTVPEQLLAALEDRFLKTGAPKDLTFVYCAGMGNGKGPGPNHLGHEGLLKRCIAGHYNLAPAIGALIFENKIEAYNLPQGVIAHLYRDIAAGKIGTLTHVGLHTFADPRLDGGKLNARTTEDIVELLTLRGKEQLFYHAFPIDICFLRGSYADEKGNVTMEKEGLSVTVTSLAQAVRNSGGKVIVQVSRIVKNGTLDPKLVKIPGIYVDYLVVVPEEQNMWEVSRDMVDVHCGDARIPVENLPAMDLDERKIIGRRAAMELTKGAVVNLGVGMPEAVALVANEEGIGDYITLTVEPGPVGGVPVSGSLFGVSVNPECILDQPYQFDFYDGGGLDLAYLGLAEADEKGSVNVSKMGPRIPGCGGFIDITQNAKKVLFCGSFTAKGLKLKTGDGKLIIVQEGSVKKFLPKVGHVTFSGNYAVSRKQPVLYITERAVFALKEDGVHLIEIAPGVDLEKEVLAHMDFKPIMKEPPKLMDARIFTDSVMGLK